MMDRLRAGSTASSLTAGGTGISGVRVLSMGILVNGKIHGPVGAMKSLVMISLTRSDEDKRVKSNRT